MRTLVIADLHLGDSARHDVLRQPAPREKLLDAPADVDRLVLLGDVVELMTRHPRRPLAIAEPVLRDIGQRVGTRREVIWCRATTTRRWSAPGPMPRGNV